MDDTTKAKITEVRNWIVPVGVVFWIVVGIFGKARSFVFQKDLYEVKGEINSNTISLE